MIEYAHHIVRAAFERAWERLKASSLEQWTEALDANDVVQPLLESAYTMFVTRNMPVTFFTTWNARMFEQAKTFLSISLEADKTLSEFFHHGNALPLNLGGDTASDVFSAEVQATVCVYIISPVEDAVLALHRFVRRAILNEVDWVVADGCIDLINVIGSEEMECPPQMVREGIPTMFGRRVDLMLRVVDTTTKIGGPDPAAVKPFAVHDEEDVIDALVDRETRIETSLGAEFPGKVRVR